MDRTMGNYPAVKITRWLSIHSFRISSQLCCLVKSKMQNCVRCPFLKDTFKLVSVIRLPGGDGDVGIGVPWGGELEEQGSWIGETCCSL